MDLFHSIFTQRMRKWRPFNHAADIRAFKIQTKLMRNQETRALYALKEKIPNKLLTVELLLRIFDASIKPILLYGCEIWAPYLNQDITKWESTPSEQMHTQFKKVYLV